MNLQLDAPNIGIIEKEWVMKCLDSTFVSTYGPFVGEFELAIKSFTGAPAVTAVQSGTAGLFMALRESGVGPGDEVILPNITFAASVNSVLYTGATPVLVDVDEATWNISTKAIKEAISDKTKAILAVHLYGNPCDMDEIISIAKQKDLIVIEDATESLGAYYKKAHTGTIGDFGVLSFNGNKVITTASGGMVLSHDQETANHIHYVVNQAKDNRPYYFHSELGYNYRMTNLQASLGLAQVERLPSFLQIKKRHFDIYKQVLGAMPQVVFQSVLDQATSSTWLIAIRIKGVKDITKLQSLLKDKGVPTRRLFTPLSEMPIYTTYADGKQEVAHKLFSEVICLPSSTLNSDEDIRQAAGVVSQVIQKERI